MIIIHILTDFSSICLHQFIMKYNIIKITASQLLSLCWYSTPCREMASLLPSICRALLFCMGFHRMVVRGKQAPTSEAPIVVIAPHSSFLDVLILCILKPCPSGVSRIDNLRDPFMGGE